MNRPSQQDLTAWVLKAQRGSASAFACLHRSHVSLVYGILLARHRPAVAEELTQECFFIAHQKLHQLREPAKFAPWLAAIARRIDANESAAIGMDEAPEPADPRGTADQMIDAATILRTIRTMPAAYRETLVLRLVEGMSGPEIAEATGLTPDSVRVNLHRGMKQLREALEITVGESKRK